MTIDSKSIYKKKIEVDGIKYTVFDIKKAAADNGFELEKLPYSLRVLVENSLRHGFAEKTMQSFKNWLKNKSSEDEVNYFPARVLMQDFTGVPAIVDLASMRDAMKKLGADPQKINPLIPIDLVIDHSVQVDSYGKKSSFEENVRIEFERNKERYQFLKWGQKSFKKFRVVPPGTGICHQVNLEYLAQVVCIEDHEGTKYAYPDTLVGTDSHTTMVNGLAVLGWGVGGIEAEAAMLGQALPMILPEVIGFKLTGKLAEGVTATDLVLTVTQILRKQGVVGKFVEFFGPGLDNLSLSDRATISNMAPEYGATCGFFPIDNETIKYLKLTGRGEHEIRVVEEYAKSQGGWRNDADPIVYTGITELDMNSVEASLAGPKRPQDRVRLSDVKNNFGESFPDSVRGGLTSSAKYKYDIDHGDLVLASITSCTNTSNPSVMVAAGLLAKKAVQLGVRSKPWVKTSLAPGSQVVTEYFNEGGLGEYLDSLGFNLIGYGCATCIGNSGPLNPEIEQIIKDRNLTVASVLSGNRNFEGRVHPYVKANYLASPPLVVAYAIAGTINIDLTKDPLAKNEAGKEIYLKDIWPTNEEIREYIKSYVTSKMFVDKYQNVFKGDKYWQQIHAAESSTYDWQPSTYINNPPYFEDIDKPVGTLGNIRNARILALFGDSITTDHISPAGSISKTSPAARFLTENGIAPADFNSYGSRRGNHEVMMRGTFANVRIKNLICPGVEGGVTINHLTGEQMSIYDAATEYKKKSIPLVIFAGKEYGTGSSRDWAAKGTNLLGVKAVIAESFERIHRSNLVGMGVLPISFKENISWKSLGLDGTEEIDIEGISDKIVPYQPLKLIIKNSGNNKTIDASLQVYTDIEIEYIKNGSILGTVIKNLNN